MNFIVSSYTNVESGSLDCLESYSSDNNSTSTYYYVFHGRVTLFFANNFLTECRITMEFLHNFF